jgi:hypothetical protein
MRKRAWGLEMTIDFFAFGSRFHKGTSAWVVLTVLLPRSLAKSGSHVTRVDRFVSGPAIRSTLLTGKEMGMKSNLLEMQAEG